MLPFDDKQVFEMIAQQALESSGLDPEDQMLDKMPQEVEEDDGFYDNLRSQMDDKDAKKLAVELLKYIEQDKSSQQDWLDTAKNMKPFLGYTLTLEDKKASGRLYKTYDSTLAIALSKQTAQFNAGLLHESGIADFKVRGEIDEAKEDRGERRRAFLNYFVTSVDRGYYDDFKKFTFLLSWYGGVAKKIYIDPISGEPRSRHIDPEDFIFNAKCSSVAECSRLTHRLRLSPRDIILKQQEGVYDPDVKLPYLTNSDAANAPDDDIGSPDNDKDGDTPSMEFTQYEVHDYCDLKRLLDPMLIDETPILPEPWIITIDATVKDVVSLRRGWKKGDPRKERIPTFLYFMRKNGFDSMGNGLSHEIGTNCAALSNIQSMTIDAAILRNNPAGFTSVRLKAQDSLMDMVPGTLTYLDTSPAPARDAFFLPPWQGADPILMELRRELLQQTQEAAAVSSMGIAELKDNAPVGTTIAHYEEAGRLRDAIFQSFCDTFIVEMSMLEEKFAETIEYQDFSFGGKTMAITQEDLTDKDIYLVPMSNPATNSSTQRLLRSEALLRLSREAPGIANEKELFRMNCEALQISPQEIERIMTPEEQPEVPALDPLTENMNMMQGRPVKAAIWQNHLAHILSHGAVSENLNLPPEARAAAAAHVQEHMAFQYLVETEQKIGMQLPPLEELQDPEVQNAIALKVAEVTHVQEQAPPIDPMQLAAEAQMQENQIKALQLEKDAEIQQMKMEMDSKIQELKATMEIFKSQLRFEEAVAKNESAERIALLKSNTELQKQGETNG